MKTTHVEVKVMTEVGANPQRQLTWTLGNTWTMDWCLRSLHGTDLGPCHVFDHRVAWTMESLTVRIGLALNAGEGAHSSSTWCSMLCASPCGACHFLNGARGGVDGKEGRCASMEREQGDRRNRNCGLNVKQMKNLLIK